MQLEGKTLKLNINENLDGKFPADIIFDRICFYQNDNYDALLCDVSIPETKGFVVQRTCTEYTTIPTDDTESFFINLKAKQLLARNSGETKNIDVLLPLSSTNQITDKASEASLKHQTSIFDIVNKIKEDCPNVDITNMKTEDLKKTIREIQNQK